MQVHDYEVDRIVIRGSAKFAQREDLEVSHGIGLFDDLKQIPPVAVGRHHIGGYVQKYGQALDTIEEPQLESSCIPFRQRRAAEQHPSMVARRAPPYRAEIVLERNRARSYDSNLKARECFAGQDRFCFQVRIDEPVEAIRSSFTKLIRTVVRLSWSCGFITGTNRRARGLRSRPVRHGFGGIEPWIEYIDKIGKLSTSVAFRGSGIDGAGDRIGVVVIGYLPTASGQMDIPSSEIRDYEFFTFRCTRRIGRSGNSNTGLPTGLLGTEKAEPIRFFEGKELSSRFVHRNDSSKFDAKRAGNSNHGSTGLGNYPGIIHDRAHPRPRTPHRPFHHTPTKEPICPITSERRPSPRIS